jgi:DNA-binding transcriptional ArsR family regulator
MTALPGPHSNPWRSEASLQASFIQDDGDIASVASLIADATRATILLSLLDGRIRPAGELAHLARVTPPTASEHLSKLVAGGLVAVEPHGRFRYYRLASSGLAEALETLATIAPPQSPARGARPQDAAPIRRARLCYDHLAGTLGVQITEALVAEGALTREDRVFVLSDSGRGAFGELGIDVGALSRQRRGLARACLDWSERRYHLAGSLGVALAARLFELKWIERTPTPRALRLTNAGRRAIKTRFGVTLF